MHAITNYAILLLQFETSFLGYFLLREDLLFLFFQKELHHTNRKYASTTWIIIQFRYPQPCIAYLHLILYYSLTLHSLIDLSRSFGSIKEKSYNNIVCQRYLTIYKDIPYLYYYNCTWSNLSISDLQLFAFRRLSTLRQICFYSEYCFSILKLHYLHRLCSYYLSLDSRKEVFLQLLLWVQKVC